VAARVGLPDLVSAGSHGFDIAGPGLRHEVGEGVPEQIESAAASLQQELAGIPGVLIEPKRFALSVHHRLTPEDRLPEIERAVEAAAAQHPKLKKALGKKLFELRPDLDWHKGKALLWVLQEMGLTGSGVLPIYIGDDLTDEDAFQAIAEIGGIGIVVLDEPRETAATYSLQDTGEVRELLDRLAVLA
jgi:trehalose-phosphatase